MYHICNNGHLSIAHDTQLILIFVYAPFRGFCFPISAIYVLQSPSSVQYEYDTALKTEVIASARPKLTLIPLKWGRSQMTGSLTRSS
jgi:hypothetical protein